MNTEFDYTELRKKIREYGYTQETLSKALEMGRVSLNQRLNNILEFSNNEIIRCCELLEIDTSEIPNYFFVEKVQKIERTKRDKESENEYSSEAIY